MKQNIYILLFLFYSIFSFGQTKEDFCYSSVNFEIESIFKNDINDENLFHFKGNKVELSFQETTTTAKIYLKQYDTNFMIIESNICSEAVGVSVYSLSTKDKSNLKLILLEDYQDIMAGEGFYAILFGANKIINTFKFCGIKYNYEKYVLKEIISVKIVNDVIYFTFDAKKITTKNKKTEYKFSINKKKEFILKR